jgi:pimeloyl-ACP methyl ester carboxylesterase/predicted glycosyltransferase
MTIRTELSRPADGSPAVLPSDTGYVTRDGVRTWYQVHGHGDLTVLLLPTWSIVHSRCWKAQVGFLSRYYRVVSFDGRGNGRSDRPGDREKYAEREYMLDALAVMDATGTEQALLMGNSTAAQRGMLLAGEHPERVSGMVLIGPYFVGTRSFEALMRLGDLGFDKWLPPIDKLRFTRRHISGHPVEFVKWFAARHFNVAHSTKQIEDLRRWAADTEGLDIAETYGADKAAPLRRRHQRALAGAVTCPALVIHGANDALIPLREGRALAEVLGADLMVVEDGGHSPHARKPALVNARILEFCQQVLGPGHEQPTAVRRRAGRPRALFVSSPIGLGHSRRDLGIARALREQVPDLEVDWFTQHPVTTMLAREGESVHPASELLALESGHIEAESGEHDLHCFQAFRRMDEILIHNFMVYRDVIDTGGYDLVVGDEAWDIDYFTHEHPSFKRTKYAWLTDFVGWLPMPDGGKEEARLTADYNAEMIGHVEGHPTVRDKAVFVGTPEDLVPGTFGANLPNIREWVSQHYDFAGYVTGYDPDALRERGELREEFGYRDDELVCIVTVGGSSVGIPLLRRVIDAHTIARRQLGNLRTIVVTGPRIDPAQLPAPEGVELRGYVHDLHRQLAACDLAVVQGGLTTTMELTAAGVPFLYFPLQHHFEQQFWVHHRLQRYGAGRKMSYAESDPDVIAAAILAEVGRTTSYQPVESQGAATAAALIAELL